MTSKQQTHNSQSWQSQAPANTMILGEHSVVYGHPALACAVDQFVTIRWTRRNDHAIHIYSALGEHHTQLEKISMHPKLKFVIAALQAFQKHLDFGLDIHIESQFSSTIGLGSSAAVLAAMLSGLNNICNSALNRIELFNIGHKIILDIQGRGSGTDLAASLAGGIVYFQPKSESQPEPIIETVNNHLDLVLVYSGYKTPTAEVLEIVAEQWQQQPKQLEMLYRSMAKVTRTAYQYLQKEQFEDFCQECKSYQHLLVKLGVSDATLESIIQALNGCVGIHAAKISGSGLGDCVLGIGQINACSASSENTLRQYQHIHIKITQQGAATQSIDDIAS